MTMLDPDVGERMPFTVVALAPDSDGLNIRAVLFHVVGGSAAHAVIRVKESMRGIIPISCFAGYFLNDEMKKAVVRI